MAQVVGVRGILYKVRNVKPGLRWGIWSGSPQRPPHVAERSGLGALAPWTLRHRKADHESLLPATTMPRIEYPKYDGVLTFDKLSSVFVSKPNHEEDQPIHLRAIPPFPSR